ncbi:UBX domain-containing protein [Colletotrichum graminicola]|uniref:UBX domain-containing protein n=1 Tax=Colletotrichum graminicola (strain M1.001 / M2 / FGSC 10212) TaxID=645133 RepID=E3QF34_COLGM|nr:UBX domain-containing protein [Colletotrichum graminicola M1.001]EFQ29472.1 UBX domain-containing protein [Colletotrichum graminicola M1.001]WDK23410.1 UBX domain-containing protein [Colletotrichum graminicola]
MAESGDLDLGQLSTSQQEALQQYTSVTNQDLKDAIPLLQRSQWNVQIAIAKFFDGEGPDPVAEAMAQEIPRTTARHENLQESLHASAGRPQAPRRDRPDPAPRIVPRPNIVHRPPFLIGLLLAPFSIGYSIASKIFRTVFYLLSFLPRQIRPRTITSGPGTGLRSTNGRRMLMPRDTAARFKREFEEEYGNTDLPWFEGGIAQAQDLAKKELKFLLIVLMSPEHDDTESFTRETLLAPDVVSFINDPANNIILWGGNILDSEAYQVAQEYNCTKYPFSAIVCLTPKEGSTRMSIIKRLAGSMPASTYLSEAQAALNKYAPDLAGVRAERTAQEVTRSLRNEQDSAYERSLARDRERARQRREAEKAAAEAARKAEEEAEAAARREEQREKWKRWRATTMKAEPPASSKDVVRIALKMPESSGAGRIVRRFQNDTTMESLYAFVECYDVLTAPEEVTEKAPVQPEDYEHTYQFRIASVMPRIVYEPSKEETMAQKIGRSGNLIVEYVSADDDSDEGDENLS